MADLTPASGFSGYDSANDNSTRSYLVFPTNSRKEITTWTRSRLQEKGRALEANFTPITRIRSIFGRKVVGTGIVPVPVTKDKEWNALAQPFFRAWAGNRFLYSSDASRNMWLDQLLDAEELGAGDGETFSAFAERDGRMTMQPLDPFEIGTPWGGIIGGKPARNAALYEDGVQHDAFTRPAMYAVRELPGPSAAYTQTFREVPAEHMIHLFRRRRVKQVRGLPPMYSGINTGNDLLDKQALETATEKLHSLLAVFQSKKAANKGKGLGNQLKEILDASGEVARLEEQLPRGAAVVEGDEGETLQLLNSTRPSQNWVEGMKFGCLFIALGVDLPASVVMGFMGLGGTAVRADLEDAQGTFEQRQDHLVWNKSEPIYMRRLARAMKDGELPMCRDPYFWAADWHGPAKITVDYGRSAAANIDLVKAGMLSIPRYLEERAIDWVSEQDRQIQWIKRAREECAKNGIDYADFVEATPGAIAAVKPAEPPPEPGDE